MNTKILYLYRDGSNYKMLNEVVVAGTFDETQIYIIMECLEAGEYFIPRQVGLPEKRFGEWTEDDHCWFELSREGFVETDAAPNIGLYAGEIVKRFLEAKGNWKKGTGYYDPEYDQVVDESVPRRQYEWFNKNASWFDQTYEQFLAENFLNEDGTEIKNGGIGV